MRQVFVSAFNSFVSEDLAGCVAEWDATAAVRSFRSHTETAAGLLNVHAVFAVFVQGARDSFENAGLPELVAARGGRLLWIADRPYRGGGDLVSDWIAIDMPFSAESVRNALDAAAETGGRASTGGARGGLSSP